MYSEFAKKLIVDFGPEVNMLATAVIEEGKLRNLLPTKKDLHHATLTIFETALQGFVLVDMATGHRDEMNHVISKIGDSEIDWLTAMTYDGIVEEEEENPNLEKGYYELLDAARCELIQFASDMINRKLIELEIFTVRGEDCITIEARRLDKDGTIWELYLQ